MKAILACLPLTAALLFAPVAHAAGLASPDDAKAMATKAAEYLKSVGPEKAFAEFDAKDGPWHDRDLYVTVQDSKGVMVAHGTNAGLIGKSVIDLKDVDGKPFNRDVQAIKDAAWIDYKWQNPADQGGGGEDLVPGARRRVHRRCRRLREVMSIQRRGCAMKLLNNLPITGKSLISTLYSARSWSLAWLASPISSFVRLPGGERYAGQVD